MSKLDLSELRPSAYYGITTMTCGACNYELAFIEPEETFQAILAMVEHARLVHNKHLAEVNSICTRY